MEPHLAEVFVPIILFLVVGAVIITSLILRHYKRQIESKEILAALERGVEIQFPDNSRARLLWGLIWTLTGLVATAALAVIPDTAPDGLWIWGLIPVAVGTAFLIVYRIENSDSNTD